MKLPDNIIMLLSRKAGVDVATPTGSDVLRHDIESATGQLLSLNTVKRLTGVIPYNCAPRPDTLKIIARYMGYPSWRLMEADSEGNVSLMGAPEGSVYPSGLLPGAVVEVTWEPGRRVTLRREPEGTFVVLEAEQTSPRRRTHRGRDSSRFSPSGLRGSAWHRQPRRIFRGG